MRNSTEWCRLTFHWPDDAPDAAFCPRSGVSAHRYLSRLAVQHADERRCVVVPELFNYSLHDNGTWYPCNHVSPFRYRGGRQSFAVTAVGEDGVDLLEQYGHRFTRMLGKDLGQPVRESWTRGNLMLAERTQIQRYVLPYFMASRKPAPRLPSAVQEPILAGTFAVHPVKQWLAERIMDSLVRQAYFLGIEPPGEDTPLRVSSVDTIVPYRTDKGAHRGQLARDVVFETPLYLGGPWNIGHFLMLGEGQLRRHAVSNRRAA